MGLAQALIHDPEVLVLDEPTAGLDPKQIIEVRQLISNLSGDHTVILSTHILPEVSTTCGRVIIINEGRIEASDTPENLTARLQGHDSIWLELDGPTDQVESKLAVVPGVEQVTLADERSGRSAWQVQADKDPSVRTALAKAVIDAGWGLFEVRSVGLSLEDIFLKLTDSDPLLDYDSDETNDSEVDEGTSSK